MIFLFIATALVLFVYGNMTYGAQAAVRYATVRSNTSLSPCTTAQIQQAVLNAMLTTGGGTITTSASWSAGNNVGSAVKVNVSVQYPVVLPFFDASSFTLTSSAAGTITN
jgi:Flp pilus assembly protein TadG